MPGDAAGTGAVSIVHSGGNLSVVIVGGLCSKMGR